MIVRIVPHQFSAMVRIPASKSHTVRRLLIASLAEGVSRIRYPLDSLDTRSCAAACRALGAGVVEHRAEEPLCPNPQDAAGEKLGAWELRGGGAGTVLETGLPISIDVGNSGTTLFLALAAAGLGTVPVRFDGDAQIRRRSAAPLLAALKALGIHTESEVGRCPITIRGPWKGGKAAIECPTSQYLSALLIAAPLAPPGTLTELDVHLLNERPYVEMTLGYLDAQNIPYEKGRDLSWFRIPGGAVYRPLSGSVPGDFSSAAFPAAAAAISGSSVRLAGLDRDDSQGDKAFFRVLEAMGCDVRWEQIANGTALCVERRNPLRGGEFDLNDTPDMLPACAVVAAFARGDTALVNVAHARIKETDRIAVMAAELGKLGVQVSERPDGLVIHGTGGIVRGGTIDSHGEHRVVMAFAAAALGAGGPIEIDGAESAAVTYPGFLELLGAKTV